MKTIKEIFPCVAAVLVFVAVSLVETSPTWAVVLICAAGILGKLGNWGYEKGTHESRQAISEFLTGPMA